MASFPFAASAINFKSGSAFTSAAIPFRRMGWSSTVRIRIRLGELCTTPHLSNQFGSIAFAATFVGNGSRNKQLNFSAFSRLAPQIEMSTDSVGTFTDSSQSPMPGSSTFFQHRRFDTFAIITNPQAQHVFAKANLGLDPLCVCMLIGISYEF